MTAAWTIRSRRGGGSRIHSTSLSSLPDLSTGHSSLCGLEDDEYEADGRRSSTSSVGGLFTPTDTRHLGWSLGNQMPDSPDGCLNYHSHSNTSVSYLGRRITREYRSTFVLPDSQQIGVTRRETFHPEEAKADIRVNLSLQGPPDEMKKLAFHHRRSRSLPSVYQRIESSLGEDEWAQIMLTTDEPRDSELLGYLGKSYQNCSGQLRADRRVTPQRNLEDFSVLHSSSTISPTIKRYRQQFDVDASRESPTRGWLSEPDTYARLSPNSRLDDFKVTTQSTFGAVNSEPSTERVEKDYCSNPSRRQLDRASQSPVLQSDKCSSKQSSLKDLPTIDRSESIIHVSRAHSAAPALNVANDDTFASISSSISSPGNMKRRRCLSAIAPEFVSKRAFSTNEWSSKNYDGSIVIQDSKSTILENDLPFSDEDNFAGKNRQKNEPILSEEEEESEENHSPGNSFSRSQTKTHEYNEDEEFNEQLPPVSLTPRNRNHEKVSINSTDLEDENEQRSQLNSALRKPRRRNGQLGGDKERLSRSKPSEDEKEDSQYSPIYENLVDRKSMKDNELEADNVEDEEGEEGDEFDKQLTSHYRREKEKSFNRESCVENDNTAPISPTYKPRKSRQIVTAKHSGFVKDNGISSHPPFIDISFEDNFPSITTTSNEPTVIDAQKRRPKLSDIFSGSITSTSLSGKKTTILYTSISPEFPGRLRKTSFPNYGLKPIMGVEHCDEKDVDEADNDGDDDDDNGFNSDDTLNGVDNPDQFSESHHINEMTFPDDDDDDNDDDNDVIGSEASGVGGVNFGPPDLLMPSPRIAREMKVRADLPRRQLTRNEPDWPLDDATASDSQTCSEDNRSGRDSIQPTTSSASDQSDSRRKGGSQTCSEDNRGGRDSVQPTTSSASDQSDSRCKNGLPINSGKPPITRIVKQPKPRIRNNDLSSSSHEGNDLLNRTKRRPVLGLSLDLKHSPIYEEPDISTSTGNSSSFRSPFDPRSNDVIHKSLSIDDQLEAMTTENWRRFKKDPDPNGSESSHTNDQSRLRGSGRSENAWLHGANEEDDEEEEDFSDMARRAERDLQARNSIGYEDESRPNARRRNIQSDEKMWKISDRRHPIVSPRASSRQTKNDDSDEDDDDDEDDLRRPILKRDLQAELAGMLDGEGDAYGERSLKSKKKKKHIRPLRHSRDPLYVNIDNADWQGPPSGLQRAESVNVKPDYSDNIQPRPLRTRDQNVPERRNKETGRPDCLIVRTRRRTMSGVTGHLPQNATTSSSSLWFGDHPVPTRTQIHAANVSPLRLSTIQLQAQAELARRRTKTRSHHTLKSNSRSHSLDKSLPNLVAGPSRSTLYGPTGRRVKGGAPLIERAISRHQSKQDGYETLSFVSVPRLEKKSTNSKREPRERITHDRQETRSVIAQAAVDLAVHAFESNDV